MGSFYARRVAIVDDARSSERQPSLHDIAVTAQVAVSTVSRYLNGQMSLRPDTERRVIEAMKTLGYTKGTRLRTAKASRTGVIGCIVPQVEYAYFAGIADGVVAAAESHGLAVLLTSTMNHSRKQLEYVDLLVEQGVDGIVYSGNFVSNRALSSAIEHGMPVVVVDEALVGAPPTDTVLVDDYAGAYQAVAHLTSLGHQRIALVTGPPTLNSVRERRHGYIDALIKAGLDPDCQLVLSGQFTEEFGVGALPRVLAAQESPTAVFAASDIIAIGMMMGAKNLGIRIPHDLSIVGFDDVPLARYVSPRLTTIRTPLAKLAESAVNALIDRMERPDTPPRVVTTPVALVVGESSAAPPRTP